MGLKDKLRKLISNEHHKLRDPDPDDGFAEFRLSPVVPEDAHSRLPTPPSSHGELGLQPESPPARHPTGKRKPSGLSVRRPPGYSPPAQGQTPPLQRTNSAEPAPEDYLYFGDPARAAQGTSTLSSSAPGGTLYRSQSQGVMRQSGAVPQSQGMASRDDSGFLNSGVRTQQVGYQNVTYGGSLQCDFSGTQPGC
jgi:hypothetical protein